MEREYSLIVAIVNRGFSVAVMDAARKAGAGGGTVLNAKGTVAENARTIFGISIVPEKESVLILADKAHRDVIMKAIVEATGLTTPGRGIVFALPAEDVLGLNKPAIQEASTTPSEESSETNINLKN